MLELSHPWPVGAYSNWLWCLSTRSPSFFQLFLAFWQNKILQAQLLFSPVLESVVSPRIPDFFKWTMVFRSQDLSISECSFLLGYPCSRILTGQKWDTHTHIYTNVDVNMCVYICVCVCVYTTSLAIHLSVNIYSFHGCCKCGCYKQRYMYLFEL